MHLDEPLQRRAKGLVPVDLGLRQAVTLFTPALVFGCASVHEVAMVTDGDVELSAAHAQLVACCAANGLVTTAELPDSQHKASWLESVAQDEALLGICHGRNCRVWVYAEDTGIVASVEPNAGPASPSEVAQSLSRCLSEARPEWRVEASRRLAPDLR